MKPLFTIQGKVIKGAARGKDLGFPTANIPLNQNIPDGIYASEVEVQGKTFRATTFIGAAETFGEKTKHAESYILEFDENIYGETMTIFLYQKIRDNKKFENAEELVDQMKKDVEATKDFFITTT